MQTSYLLNVQTSISILLNIRWAVNMYAALNIQCNILNSLGVFFLLLQSIFQRKLHLLLQKCFFLMLFFSFLQFYTSVLFPFTISLD